MAAPNSQGRTHGRSRFSGRALSLSRRLFRQEAIDHQRFGIWGAVALTLPKSYALVTGFIALSVLAMALFIATQQTLCARRRQSRESRLPGARARRFPTQHRILVL